MNQILIIKNSRKKIKKYKVLFFLSLALIIFFLVYEILIYCSLNNKEKISSNLKISFNLEKLYSLQQKDNYTITRLNDSNTPFVIGIIEIPKINISYPILSKFNDELLKVSPCRFYGSYPNTIGNMCVAGHNYDDNRFFGNLKSLEIRDKINIYDSNNCIVSYYIYDKFEIEDSNTSCTNQNTHGKREITLVTCNNFNKKRLIIKAKEGYY